MYSGKERWEAAQDVLRACAERRERLQIAVVSDSLVERVDSHWWWVSLRILAVWRGQEDEEGGM